VISSPSGAKLYQSEIHSYFHSSNFGFQGQAMAERQYAEPVSAEQYFQQVIKPNMERGGARFVSSYPLPVYKDFFQKAADSLGSIRSRVRHDAIGSDWETQNGTKVMLVSVARYLEQASALTWDVIITQMEAPTANFDAARETLLLGVQNAELGRENIQSLNAGLRDFHQRNDTKWKGINDRARIAHESNMSVIREAGIRSDNFARESQRRSIRTIRGETVIGTPGTNQGYTVDSGYQNYWVNPDGEYIPTNDRPCLGVARRRFFYTKRL